MLYHFISTKEKDMSRIKKLETHYQQKLTNHDVKNTSEFIQSILDSDITKGKYARFLIDSFLNDKFLEEDLIGGLDSTVGQAISLFDKHKGKLPLEQRSVYALNKETKLPLYQSPGDLWNVVKQYQGELSGKELKKEEQEKIYRETEFVYKDEKTGFQIISPLTEESAQWWGKGTRWCTSANNDNMFWNYAKDAPLLILLIPTNNNVTKLQLWKNNNRIQFMDESDNEVSLNYMEKKWNLLKSICLWLNDIKYIPKSVMTKDICELVVKNNGKVLQNIPEEFKTEELCELAVNQDGRALEYVPEEYKTKEMCELAIKQNEYALGYVPDELRTQELCKLAVQQSGALYGVPKELRTKEIYELAIQQNGYALGYVPKELITKELCKLAIKQNGCALGNIPEEFKKEIIENNQNIFQIDKDKYQATFKELKKYFPKDSISLDSK
jgi:hypothetical protein